MKRFLIGASYGVIGLAVAIALTLGAYAVAGQDLSRPANPVGAGKALEPGGSSSPAAERSAARKEQLKQHRIAQRQHQRQVAMRQQARPSGPFSPAVPLPSPSTGPHPSGGAADNSGGQLNSGSPGRSSGSGGTSSDGGSGGSDSTADD